MRRRRLAVVVDQFEIHGQAPFFAGVFAAGRTTMWPPSAPGTAALDQQQAALGIDAHDLQCLRRCA